MKRGNVQTNSSERNSKRIKLQPQNEEFSKLNQSDEVHARRIQQRRRMVAKGKNTVGYDEYSKTIPRHKRRPRCMEHPVTPDHTLDIPNKRWQGLVKAWRKALHQYDPPDLMKALNESATAAAKESATPAKPANSPSVQAKQLSEAVESGLLVDVSPERLTNEDSSKIISPEVEEVDELAEYENARGANDEFFLDEEDSDDDDLL